MRTHHFLVLLIINLSLDTSSNHTVFQILIPLLPLIWALGMLGNLYVSVIYCIEKFSQYLLGASETSSTDTRLIMSTGARLLVILIISLIVNAAYGEVTILSHCNEEWFVNERESFDGECILSISREINFKIFPFIFTEKSDFFCWFS